jgi:GT2 family glycosyltransferase
MASGTRRAEKLDAPAVDPVRILEIELSDPLADVDAVGSYRRALAIVRLHSVPIGLVTVDLTDGRATAAEVARAVDAELRAAVNRHLAADGASPVERVGAGGVPMAGAPRCAAAREAYLALDPPFVSVIVPTRERAERLGRCLTSILRTAYPVDRREVIVVDNDPRTAETRDLLKRSFPGVRYVREDAPGSASARNRGVDHAAGELVVFTDDDVLVDRYWLLELARAYEDAPAVGAVTGLLVPMELETPAQVWFEQYGGFGRGYERRTYNLTDSRPPDPLFPYSAGVFGTGNSMSFRRSALEAIGGFDPALGNGTPALGGVDSEVLLRTVLEGHTVVYEPRSLAYHAHRRDYAGLRRQIYSYGTGLSAYLLKTMIERPRLLPDFAARVPRGFVYALSPRSGKNARKERGYPRRLTFDELRGMAYGPVAYFRSRRRYGPADPRRRHAARRD